MYVLLPSDSLAVYSPRLCADCLGWFPGVLCKRLTWLCYIPAPPNPPPLSSSPPPPPPLLPFYSSVFVSNPLDSLVSVWDDGLSKDAYIASMSLVDKLEEEGADD